VNSVIDKTLTIGIIVAWVLTAAVMILACSIWYLVGLYDKYLYDKKRPLNNKINIW
jgi:hypothetical protein